MSQQFDNLCLGIDLGTTNSAASIIEVQGERIRSIPVSIDRPTDINKNGGCRRKRGNTLPSAVFYQKGLPNDDSIIVGDAAKNRAKVQSFSTALSVKSQMGNERLSYPNWDPQCPDQTPQDVSSRILCTVLDSVEREHYERPARAVITVPASYSIAQRNATKLAAEKAGLTITDDMLLSEPEAVMYCALNQQANGELSLRQDFTTPKNIMVYDIGGGTLDITLHQVRCASDNPDLFQIRGIATNRYSSTAGDTFDMALADWMYKKYLDTYAQDADAHRQIQRDKESVINYLKSYAEDVKEEISNRYASAKLRGREVPKDSDFEFGGAMPKGYDFEDYIQLEEFEACLYPLMGWEYSYDQYKNFSQLPEQRNIIYPLLDVLNRASKKLKTPDVTVDMVILNGGMSRLYLIEERLNQFFGFNVTTISDPDLSVAKGAAVYHYYLVKNENLMEHDNSSFAPEENLPAPQPKLGGFRNLSSGIQTTSNTLNESIYLGLRNGAEPLCIAEAGQDLPYTSGEIKNLYMESGVNHIFFPIQEKRGNTYTTIASGVIKFPFTKQEEQITLVFKLSLNGVLSIKATAGTREGHAEITLSREIAEKAGGGSRAVSGAGGILNPNNELHRLKDLVRQLDTLEKRGLRGKAKEPINTKIRSSINSIKSCGNPEAFSGLILQELSICSSKALELNLVKLSRYLCKHWTTQEQSRLAGLCRTKIRHAAEGFVRSSFDINVIKSYILTLGTCGNEQDGDLIFQLHHDTRYRTEILSALAVLGVHQDWILNQLEKDLENNSPALQEPLHALGQSLIENPAGIPLPKLMKIADLFLDDINHGYSANHELVLMFGSLGLIYSIVQDTPESVRLKNNIMDTANQLEELYGSSTAQHTGKCISVLSNRLNGALNDNDNIYLLSLFNIQD